jgi:general secretion pathway protein H
MRSIRQGRDNEGFTLLEVLLVLLLIVLILGVATPFFAGRLPSARLDATGREISAAMRYTRTLARTDNERKAFIVDLDARQYGIGGLAQRDIPPEIGVRVIDPVEGEVLRGRYTIRFYESGAAGGGSIQLTSGRRKLVIETDPVIGAVVIK